MSAFSWEVSQGLTSRPLASAIALCHSVGLVRLHHDVLISTEQLAGKALERLAQSSILHISSFSFRIEWVYSQVVDAAVHKASRAVDFGSILAIEAPQAAAPAEADATAQQKRGHSSIQQLARTSI
jgi:hypothetical protein